MVDWINDFDCHVTVDMIVYCQGNIQIDWNLVVKDTVVAEGQGEFFGI